MKNAIDREPLVDQQLSLEEVILIRNFKSRVITIFSVIVGGIALSWLVVYVLRNAAKLLTHI